MKKSTLVVSTRNPHKLAELKAMLAGSGLELKTPLDFDNIPEVEEDRDTLEGNAQKKSEALFHATGIASIADDTGLEVDALGGRPGVYSARYAGEKATYAENVTKLLGELSGVPIERRTARFRTVIAFTDVSGTRFFEGVCEGKIQFERKGTAGFGYDPVFQPEGFERHFAEMTDEEKNAISHRGRAMKAFGKFMTQIE